MFTCWNIRDTITAGMPTLNEKAAFYWSD